MSAPSPSQPGPQLEIAPPPRVGSEVIITLTRDGSVPSAGVTVTATRFPGLPAQEEVALGLTDGWGRVRWAPSAGGVYAVSAHGTTALASVPWPSPPIEAAAPLAALLVVSALSAAWGLTRPRWKPPEP